MRKPIRTKKTAPANVPAAAETPATPAAETAAPRPPEIRKRAERRLDTPADPATAAASAPATSPATPAPPPEFRRVVGLPARPRLRVSYWIEGDKLACEATLMDERRELVRRSRVNVDDDPSVARIFSYFATRLVNELRADGVLVAAPPSPSSREPDPSASSREPSRRRQPPPGVRLGRPGERLGSSPSSRAEPGSSSSSNDEPKTSPSSDDEHGPETPRG